MKKKKKKRDLEILTDGKIQAHERLKGTLFIMTPPPPPTPPPKKSIPFFGVSLSFKLQNNT